MRNKVAKKLRKAAGNQNSTSNRIEYKEAKREHNTHTVEVKPKISKRQVRPDVKEQVENRKEIFWKKEMKRREKAGKTKI